VNQQEERRFVRPLDVIQDEQQAVRLRRPDQPLAYLAEQREPLPAIKLGADDS